MNNLIKYNKNLPVKLDDLIKFVLIGREKLVAVRAGIRAINKLELATEVREQKQEEAQMLAGALLDAEVKIGELLKNIPIKPLINTETARAGSFGGSKKVLPPGITHHQSSQFQALADHPEVIEQVKAEAKENDDLPTRTEVLRIINKIKKENKPTPPLPTGKYNVIYADPPWQYDNMGFDQSAQSHYTTMSVEEICNLSIPDLIDKKAVLFLWVTNAFVKEGLQVIDKWGFEYKTNMVWIKNKGMGIGWFMQGRHELLFIATKGEGMHPKYKPISWFESEVTKHSKKPEQVYELIEKMYDKPYIELFGRNNRKGWDVWGKEAPDTGKSEK